jgi:hypothetical protein
MAVRLVRGARWCGALGRSLRRLQGLEEATGSVRVMDHGRELAGFWPDKAA